MILDRAELAGTGAALAFHIALIAAMSLSLAHVASAPEPPAMEVELVEDVGLEAATPTPMVAPPPSQAPEMGDAPVIEPARAPTVEPAAPSLRVMPAPARPQKAAPTTKPPRVSRIGDDFLTGIAESPAAAKPAAATFDARAKASVAALFKRLVQPCANKQINPGEGANRIRVTVNLSLRPTGRLAGTPQIVRVTGVDDENRRYEERLRDLAVAVYRECAPFSGLPPELYRTAEGGWSNINLTYKLP